MRNYKTLQKKKKKGCRQKPKVESWQSFGSQSRVFSIHKSADHNHFHAWPCVMPANLYTPVKILKTALMVALTSILTQHIRHTHKHKGSWRKVLSGSLCCLPNVTDHQNSTACNRSVKTIEILQEVHSSIKSALRIIHQGCHKCQLNSPALSVNMLIADHWPKPDEVIL